jgi:uracil-DNA glycosylase
MTWEDLLSEEIKKSYFLELAAAIKQKSDVCPSKQDMFRALELVKFDEITVVIIGQDPYHGEAQANGLAFSVNKDQSIPPSLRNIFKEIETDVSIKNNCGDLTHWAKQGVLLLNSILTVTKDHPGSHANLGWEKFTNKIILDISTHLNDVVFLLWGAYARSKNSLIDSNKHLILESPHPSPLSAHTGFLGGKHFSRTNEFLNSKGKAVIDWRTI